MTQVDRIAPLRFLRTAYEPSDWLAVFLKSYETGQVAQRVGPRSFVASRRFQSWLRWRNLLRWNIYVSVNAIAPHRRSRTRDAVAAIRHVFLEADHDGPHLLATIADRCDLPSVSYVLHSSANRVHVFWRASGFSVDQVESLQTTLAEQCGTDLAATPWTQTTRLPGFFNHKRDQPHLVTIEYLNPERLYVPGDFPPVPAKPRCIEQSPCQIRVTASGQAVERARRYLSVVPPAVSGRHGDVHTFRVCCRLVRGFALDDEDALAVLADWNTRCEPPWSERELRDKLRRAKKYGREPIGALLVERRRLRAI